TRDRDPVERFGLSEEELTTILERYSQSFNLGTEDLARSIGAAELQAATHKTGVATASDIMSKDMVTVTPDTDFASLFRHHRFTSLPVVGEGNRFFGTIFQIHLIDRAREDALRLHRGFLPAMMRLVDAKRDRPVRAKDIMSVAGPRAIETTPFAALLPLMAQGNVDAVPVLYCGHCDPNRSHRRSRSDQFGTIGEVVATASK
ncbi:CBS domain-containing protein, partial [Falsihalocynthiibacter sp. CO-5D18]|uniref:CBS domain-containing protein n=1 Tax=Falsihalocynthiibacter sp. CO-5D18 TaxID=3240872 RepID=UPI00350EC6B1